MRALFALATIAILAPAVATAAVEDDLREGDKHFERGDWKRAAAAYDRAIATAPGQVAAGAYGKRAAIYILVEDWRGGLAFIQRAKARFPNAPEILEQEALILWESDRKDDAIKVAERVVKAKPATFTNQKLIGEYYAQRDPVKTAAALEAYLQHRPAELEGGDVFPRIRLGFAYVANARSVFADGDSTRAEALYLKASEQFEYLQRKLGKKPNAMVNAENGLCAAYTGLGRWDQAISVCERVIRDPKRIDASGSAWFNLATAYLRRKRFKQARSAANEFVRVRKGEARAHLLLGETYFEERDWGNALDQFTRAERAIKPNQARERVELSKWLGKTYRRLPAPASGPNPNLALAIEKLDAGLAANPTSIELAIELGGAYLEAKQDAKATALADRLLAGAELPRAPAEQRAALLVIAGKSLFNQKKLAEARQRFESARELRAADVQIQRALIVTINEQAYAEGKDAKAAQALLEQALAIDARAPMTRTNLAVLAIERGDCDGAQRQLVKLGDVPGTDAVLTARLTARSHLCASKPDPRKASEAYAAAEREAKKANAQLALAEIYTEWVPLTWDAELAGAVEKLELAVQAGSQDPEIAPATKRNLALALYRRGWKRMRDGKAVEAAGDFERALRDPSALRGSEPLALELSFALAQLEAGRSAEAAKRLETLAGRGNHGAYLKGPYAKVGSQLLSGYASFRGATGAARQQACTALGKLEGDLGAKARELVASCWELVAHEQWRAGQPGAAQKALAAAEKSATPEQRRRLALDRAAIALGKDRLPELEGLAPTLPEALVNIGIVHDMMGKPKEAYEAWSRAKAKGVTSRELQRWLDAKKRIYGY